MLPNCRDKKIVKAKDTSPCAGSVVSHLSTSPMTMPVP